MMRRTGGFYQKLALGFWLSAIAGGCLLYTSERSVYRRIEKARFLLEQCRMRLQLKDPVRMVNDKRQRLADLEQALQRKMKDLLETEKTRLKEDRLVLERLTQTAVTKEKHLSLIHI